MNIVFHRYNNICEPGYIDAFTRLGIEVIEDDMEIREKSIPGDVRITTIAEYILKNRPMFVFSINFFPYISDICEKLNTIYVCITVDCPVAELFSVSVRNECNRIFLFDSAQYDLLKNENPGRIFHIPLGVNPQISDAARPFIPSDDTVSEYKYGVSFVGSLYNEKNPYRDIAPKLPERTRGFCDGIIAAQEVLGGMDLLDAIALSSSAELSQTVDALEEYMPEALKFKEDMITDIPLFWTVDTCFGSELTVRDRLLFLASVSESIRDIDILHLFTRSDISGLGSIAPAIAFHGGVSTLREMPEVFAGSKINLNITMRPIRRGLPQRIWDVLGCGGFLLTDVRNDMPEGLVAGKHLEVYEDVSDACEKVRYYLTHEDERKEIARSGYEAALSENMIMNRVVSMIRVISEQ
ncbi:MAG: DUF3880 domain-containing protein [Lachnospiraceae bacterium]|nr:DUF3880 domain-containing protein [Lachnospiraceae bacterium]